MTTQLSASIRLRLISDIDSKAKAIAGRINELQTQIEQTGDQGGQATAELGQKFKELAAVTREAERAERDFARSQQFLAREASAAEEAIEQLGTATRAGTAGQQGMAAGMRGISDEAKRSGREMGGTVNVVAEMAYSFGTAIPSMREYGTQLAMMGGNAYQLGAAFGPMGVGIGVVMGLLPSLITMFSDADGAMDGAATQAERAARGFDTLRDSIRDAREEQEEWTRLMDGGESAAETRDALATQENIATEARKTLDNRRRALRQTNRSMSGSRFVRSAFDDAITSGATTEQELFDTVWQQVERRMESQGYTGARYASQREDIRRTVERDAQRMGRQLRGIREAEDEVAQQESRTENLRTAVVAAETREAEEQAEEDAREAEQNRSERAGAIRGELGDHIAGLPRRLRGRARQYLADGTLLQRRGIMRRFEDGDRVRELVNASDEIAQEDRERRRAAGDRALQGPPQRIEVDITAGEGLRANARAVTPGTEVTNIGTGTAVGGAG